MPPQGRGRGRARGRGRDQAPAPAPAPAPGPAPGPAAVQIPPLQGAWARRPAQPPQAQPQQQPQAQARPPAQAAQPRPPVGGVGRGVARPGGRGDAEIRDVQKRVQGVAIGATGDGAAPAPVGRGAMRGRREIQAAVITRPPLLATKQGTSGDRILLQANYFKLLNTTDWCLYQYRVDFAPEVDRTVIRKALLRPHKGTLGAYIFDGTVLYTSHRLPENLEVFSQRQSDDERIRINIRLVGDLARGDQHYLQFFNIIMRKCLGHLNLQLVGRDFYDALAKIEIRDFQLELWPGYITSIRQHERDILMCSEISHKVMRQQTVYDILVNCRNNSRDFKKDFANMVIGQVVLTGYNNNTYRIEDIDFAVTPQSTFNLRDGQSISYQNYYKSKYNINIRNSTQPMLVTKSKPRQRRAGESELVYLVPELCRATGITDDMRSNWQLMKAMSEYTRVGPASRIAKLLAFNKRLRTQPEVQTDLTEWNMKLSDSLVSVPGRVLQKQNILFAKAQKLDAGPQADWTRDLRKVQMLVCKKLENWAVITTKRAAREVDPFLTTLMKISAGLGFLMKRPTVHEIDDDRANSYVRAIENILSTVSVQLVFCVVPNNRPERYAAIKKMCCCNRPVPSQVFLAKNLTNKGLESIATKVGIQMNCKIGGAPWTVEIPPTGVMFVGYDVCHDTAQKGRDYGALVASLDRYCTRYFSVVSPHCNGEELSNDLSANMFKALLSYRSANGSLPEKIIFFRDGVGEGQVPYVFNHEVEQLKSRLAQAYGEVQCKLAFIIVTKGIKTRIFYNKSNPPPGTVVDDVITDPTKYDFFLVSQSVTQGSVSPTSFSIISDNVGLSADRMQQLCYKMTHMYFNWSGTVRVPAPCQYAHKLAFLVSTYLHRAPDQGIENLFFYL